MTVDLEAMVKWRKDNETKVINHRQKKDLNDAERWIKKRNRPEFLADTNVYGHIGKNGEPEDVLMRLLKKNPLLHHCSVCLGEISLGIANTRDAAKRIDYLKYYATIFKDIPEERLYTLDQEIWIKAGIIAGKLARRQNLQKHQRKELLNDALIFLTAAKHGIPVLTSDRNDYDLIQQLDPDGGFVFYEVTAQSLATPEQQRAPAFVAQAGDQG